MPRRRLGLLAASWDPFGCCWRVVGSVCPREGTPKTATDWNQRTQARQVPALPSRSCEEKACCLSLLRSPLLYRQLCQSPRSSHPR